ncbi:MAG: hypothetical protein ACOYOO_05870 [Saprospiraceae bacterium]
MAKGNPKLDYMVDTVRGMVRTIAAQTGGDLIFSALLYKSGRKLNSIELADAHAFSKLVRQYVKSEMPDKVRVELRTQGDNVQRWMKQFELGESPLGPALPNNENFLGLGEAEIGELVSKRFEELERQRELERAHQELAEMRLRHEELEREAEDLSAQLEAKNQMEHLLRILSMAFPGLARMLKGTPIGEFLGQLSGAEGELEAPRPSGGAEDGETVAAVASMVRGLSEKEAAVLYLLLLEVEKDRSALQRVLDFITKG